MLVIVTALNNVDNLLEKRRALDSAERPRSGTGYRRRAFDCGLKVIVTEIIATRSG